jgi:hypothetical protein
MKLKNQILFSLTFFTLVSSSLAVNTTLNVNAIANAVLPDSPVEYEFHFNGKYDDLTIQKFKTGRKDMAGNEEVYLMLIETDIKDTFYLVPDNHVYPLFFREFSTSKKPEVSDEGFRHGFGLGASRYVMVQSKMATIMQSGASWGFVKDYEKSGTDRGYLIQLSEREQEFLKTESTKLWELIETYYTSLLDGIKGKKYDDMMRKLDGKKIMMQRIQRRGNGSDDYVDVPKIAFNSDASGKLTELILWYPFMDGKYYDKPEFKKTITKAANGLFYVETKDEAQTGFLNGYFVPYSEGFLIMGAPATDQYGYGVPECKVSAAGIVNPWDMELFNIQEDGKLFYDEVSNRNLGGLYNSKILEQYYNDWWKTKNVTMTYERSKDTRGIAIWLPQYFNAVLETAK